MSNISLGTNPLWLFCLRIGRNKPSLPNCTELFKKLKRLFLNALPCELYDGLRCDIMLREVLLKSNVLIYTNQLNDVFPSNTITSMLCCSLAVVIYFHPWGTRWRIQNVLGFDFRLRRSAAWNSIPLFFFVGLHFSTTWFPHESTRCTLRFLVYFSHSIVAQCCLHFGGTNSRVLLSPPQLPTKQVTELRFVIKLVKKKTSKNIFWIKIHKGRRYA